MISGNAKLPRVGVWIGFFLFMSPKAWSWGARGHDWICQMAAESVPKLRLRSFLKGKEDQLGYLCNIPDSFWKTSLAEAHQKGKSPSKLTANSLKIEKNLRQLEAPTHYLDLDLISEDWRSLPRSYSEALRRLQGALKPAGKNTKLRSGASLNLRAVDLDSHRRIGSLWWRVDQLEREILKLKTDLSQIADSVPALGAGADSGASPRESAALRHLILMGLLGHYVGDASMPLHNSSDYDAAKAGHLGLHSFYENTLVQELSAEDRLLIFKESEKILAQKQLPFLRAQSGFEVVRELSILSFQEIEALLVLDAEILQKKQEGKPTRATLVNDSGKTWIGFQKLLLRHLSWAVAALAHIWTLQYQALGEPNLEWNHWRTFPHTPDYIAPDYLFQPRKKY